MSTQWCCCGHGCGGSATIVAVGALLWEQLMCGEQFARWWRWWRWWQGGRCSRRCDECLGNGVYNICRDFVGVKVRLGSLLLHCPLRVSLGGDTLSCTVRRPRPPASVRRAGDVSAPHRADRYPPPATLRRPKAVLREATVLRPPGEVAKASLNRASSSWKSATNFFCGFDGKLTTCGTRRVFSASMGVKCEEMGGRRPRRRM